MKIQLALCVVLAFTTPSTAAGTTAMIKGVGIISCANFMTFPPTPTNLESLVHEWTVGLWSGLNAERSAHDQPTRDLNAPDASDPAKMHQYCDAHQTEDVLSAAVHVYVTLPVVQVDKH